MPAIEGGVLLLEVEPNGRALLEHKDNRSLLMGAFNATYGRRLEYRVVVSAAAAVALPPRPSAPVAPASAPVADAGPPAGFDDADDPGPAGAGAAPATVPGPTEDASSSSAAARRKQPGDLSPGARSAMLWLEGEIVGPARPNPPSSRGPA